MAVSISIAITQNSQNTANNTSNVTVSVSAKWTYGSWNATGECYGSVTIDGTKYSYDGIKFNTGQSTSGSQVIMTKTVDVDHNADGSKTLNCSASFYTGLSGSGTQTASASKALTTIARASQPSCVTWPEHTQDVGEFGDTISIHMNRKNDSFTHTVRYQFGEQSGTIATGVTNGTTWTIPMELMRLIPNATSGSGTIYVDTYNGSTLVGTKYCGFTATVPASVKPTVSATLDDITGMDDIYGTPVKGLSKIKIISKITLAYGSSIASCVIKANGVTYNAYTATTGVLTTSGSSVITVTAVDRRGRTGTWSYNMTVKDYNAPTVSNLTVKRCDSNGTENDKGEHAQATFSAAVSSMDGDNTATYTLRYKKSTDTTWTTVAFSALNNTYTVTNQTYVFAADGNDSYDVDVIVTDKHSTVTRSTSVSTAFTLFNCHESGTGIRFGGVADKEDTLQNDLSLNQVGNSYAFQPDSFSGAKGYTLLATINLKALNVNAPIVFIINKRGALCPMTVYARFASSSTTLDPDLDSFTYDGDNMGAFMVKTATSTWKLYVDNTNGWSNPCLQSWYTTENQKSRLSVTFSNEQVEGTEPNVLGTYYRAIPAKMQSILDFIYPVGSIYLSYSHVSPETLFGGTWKRIENAFLWATTSTGAIGQTGGESEHTLLVKELPAHSHGSVYSGNVSGTKTHGWLASGGSSMAYGTVETGLGVPHNNMPPYIQVSAWRRTA